MGGFYEKDTPALQRAREAEMMARTREHTAKGAKPSARSLGPETIVHNNGFGGVNQMAAVGPSMARESAAEVRGREEALRIVGAIR